MASNPKQVSVKVNADLTALETKLTRLADDANRTVTELRAAVREAHEVLSDLAAGIKRAEAVRREYLNSDELAKRLRDVTANELECYMTEITRAVKAGTQAAYDRFDTIIAICLGTDQLTKRPLEELIRDFLRTKELPYKLTSLDEDEPPEAFRAKGVRILADATMDEDSSLMVRNGPAGPRVFQIDKLVDLGPPGSLFSGTGLMRLIADSDEGDDKP